MNSQEILRFCLEKGFLLDKEVLGLFTDSDVESAKLIIEKIKDSTNQKIITRSLFTQNREKLIRIISTLPKENQQQLEDLKIKLGLHIEISSSQKIENLDENKPSSVKVLSPILKPTYKKIEVQDFTKYFRNRLNAMKGILQSSGLLKNLVSINKLSNSRQNVSIIGLVSEKSITKNKNVIFEVEDLTGKIKVLISEQNKNLYEKMGDVSLDSVLGFSGVGNKEIIFASDIVFPECMLPERKFSPVEEYALFLGDIHFGSKLFLENSFNKFIDYLNGKVPNTPEVEQIKYLFIVGDLVSGVGVYPNQERDLEIKDIEEQFIQLSKILAKIPQRIQIIISPGNHEGIRLMEPQPLLNEHFSWSLYQLPNVILVGNPAFVNFGARDNFSGFDVLIYHGASFHYYANTVPKLIVENALKKAPEKIMHYLLKNRHLSPSHSSVQYFPSEEDYHFIKNVPDIFVSGHVHKSSLSYCNNILVMSTSSWESKTPYQEKMGNEPDFCKVPLFNLKTRAIKILDFEEKND